MALQSEEKLYFILTAVIWLHLSVATGKAPEHQLSQITTEVPAGISAACEVNLKFRLIQQIIIFDLRSTAPSPAGFSSSSFPS